MTVGNTSIKVKLKNIEDLDNIENLKSFKV